MSDYRDVTPNQQFPPSTQTLTEVLHYVVRYLKHPLHEIKSIPDWNWSTLIVTLIALSMSSGFLTGLIPPNIFRIMSGLIISPMVAVLTAFISSLFIYYYFQVFEHRTCSLRKIFTLILFANIPFLIFQTVSDIFPPIALVGFAFTSLITAVGLTENFQLPKKRSLRLVTAIYAVIFIIWIWNHFDL